MTAAPGNNDITPPVLAQGKVLLCAGAPSGWMRVERASSGSVSGSTITTGERGGISAWQHGISAQEALRGRAEHWAVVGRRPWRAVTERGSVRWGV